MCWVETSSILLTISQSLLPLLVFSLSGFFLGDCVCFKSLSKDYQEDASFKIRRGFSNCIASPECFVFLNFLFIVSLVQLVSFYLFVVGGVLSLYPPSILLASPSIKTSRLFFSAENFFVCHSAYFLSFLFQSSGVPSSFVVETSDLLGSRLKTSSGGDTDREC